ncbi:hypothetical protein AKJ58_01225 [candidate division MSBL1 archaeon SCGC-AAA385D11]|uniref:Uracil-DNA glycosylase-like domain-containing protein n=1 Tax=candidate division MSBL1 archaeon SCGC-AAA385D11 TaxID=1698286 RepID=A0A133VNG5_9EURY|nr:hypothetical protein AKJ58_01225 [candidate division MSBL1 archaeon SCGC-AAA385D11]
MFQNKRKLKSLLKEMWECSECSDSERESEKSYGQINVDLSETWAKNFKRSTFLKGPWIFPPYKVQNDKGEMKLVRGFFGKGGDKGIMFIAERPSTGKFPDKRCRMFYELLAKNNLHDAHLTDFVKCRGLVREGVKKVKENCFERILKREIEIVAPKIVIPIGNEAERLCKQYLVEDILEEKKLKEKIIHYAYRFDSKENVKKEIQGRLEKFRD